MKLLFFLNAFRKSTPESTPFYLQGSLFYTETELNTPERLLKSLEKYDQKEFPIYIDKKFKAIAVQKIFEKEDIFNRVKKLSKYFGFGV